MTEYILETKNITKTFPGVKALDQVSLQLEKGEVLGLCGENGAGKSTLMKVLSGSYPSSAYDGEVWIDGKRVDLVNVRTAQNYGIEMVYQELNMILTASIAENLYVSQLPGKNGCVNWKKLYADTQEVLDRINLKVDPKTQAGLLNSGQLQMLSIMRAVVRNPRIIVLDEPTSCLTDNETEILFRLVAELKQQGCAILFISHKLDEVFRIADRITVMRDGKIISTQKSTDVSHAKLIEMMVGRSIENQYPKVKAQIGEELLRVEHLTVPHPTLKDRNIVEDISITLHRGEVLGLGGLVGAGRSEALEAIFGRTKNGVTKEVYVKGKSVAIHSPRHAKQHGIGFVTEERRLTGFIPSFSICHNLSLCVLDAISRFGFISKNEERKKAHEMFHQMKIKAPSLNTSIITLSGGNQQKVVLGKWLLANPEILLIDEPTKGIDVGAKTEIYKEICRLASQGIGIIMVSSDMSELVAMSDRVLVLSNGRITGEFVGETIDQEKILAAAIAQ